MSNKIDWYYHRPGCKTCAKMDELLDSHGIGVTETVNAKKTKLDRDDALEISRGATRIVAAKGKKIIDFDLSNGLIDETEVLNAIVGPTGKLRAPTLRKSHTLVVGFHDELLERAGF